MRRAAAGGPTYTRRVFRTTFPARATTVFLVMTTVVVAVGIVLWIASSGEDRLARLDAMAQQKVVEAYDRMIRSAEAFKLEELFGEVLENDQGALAVNGELFLTRAAALERTRENFRGIARLEYRVTGRHVTMLAPDAAVLVATGTSEVELNDGRRFPNAFAHTVVFLWRDGAWRVIHSHQATPVRR